MDDDAANDPGPGDPSVSDPLEDGSIDHPYDAIQEGIDASVDYDTVMVADGTYTGTGNRDIDYGGRLIIVCSASGPEDCIIDCQGTEIDPHRGFYFHSGETAEVVVQGFTIRNGYAAVPIVEHGGGIYATVSHPTILGNIITGNTATKGGGIRTHNSNSLIDGNVIDGNTAISGGGGIYHNFGTSSIVNNHIINNMADQSGGGLNFEDSDLIIFNNVFSANFVPGVSGLGAGGAITAVASEFECLNNTITGNTAAEHGGAIYIVPIQDDDSVITNTIFWENSAPDGSDTVYLWASETSPNTLTISYSLIEDGSASVLIYDPYSTQTLNWGPGNIDADPLFVTGPRGDYCLSQTAAGQGSNSPCLEAGSDLAANICHTNHEGTVCLNTLTTRTDGIADGYYVDMGFHYPTEQAIHVPDDYATIQEAINHAFDRDTIIVSAGIYVETIDFLGKAITVRSKDGPEVTIIDGNGTGPVVSFLSGEDIDSVLRGFTITGGLSSGDGGGISCRNGSSPLISSNIITGNTSTVDGGGIFCHNSSPKISNNTIHGNTANDDGAGIYGYNHSGEIDNNLIYNNTASDWGGGIGCSGCSCRISSTTIVGNSSVNSGGGLYLYDSWAALLDSILWDNSAPSGPEIYLSASAYPSTLNLYYSDVEGGEEAAYVSPNSTLNWGTGMFNSDPLFVTGQGGDYYLSQVSEGEGSDSPCLDTGSDLAENICFTGSDGKPFCLDERTTRSGHHDVDTGTVDIGYHYQYWCCDCDGDWYDNEDCGGTDCDDTSGLTNPGASEICDGEDNDCSGAPASDEADDDEDGWMICEGDCNDGDPDMNPGVEESRAAGNCDDGKDNDCDGAPDGADTDCGVTMTASMTCVPGSGTLPFSTQMTVTLNNEYQGLTRRIAGRINVDLANGSSVSNWKSGWSNIDVGSNLISAWNQTIPALGSLVGNNVFTLLAEDVTPSPYNQPPHPPAGDTDTDVCTVTGTAP